MIHSSGFSSMFLCFALRKPQIIKAGVFSVYNTIAERKLDRGQNRKRKGMGGGGGGERRSLLSLARQGRNVSNLTNKKRKADDLKRSPALLCLCLVTID